MSQKPESARRNPKNRHTQKEPYSVPPTAWGMWPEQAQCYLPELGCMPNGVQQKPSHCNAT